MINGQVVKLKYTASPARCFGRPGPHTAVSATTVWVSGSPERGGALQTGESLMGAGGCLKYPGLGRKSGSPRFAVTEEGLWSGGSECDQWYTLASAQD